MNATLIDSNILLDIATKDPIWFDWSSQALEAAANESPLIIDAITLRFPFALDALKSLNPQSPQLCTAESRYPLRQHFWPEKHFSATVVVAARGCGPSPIFS